LLSAAASLEQVPGFAKQVVDALEGSGEIVVLGNGGSAAIARCVALTGTFSAKSTGIDIRVPDVLEVWSSAVTTGSDDGYAAVLGRTRHSCKSATLLLSGSGDSENLVRVARGCRDAARPVGVVAGNGGGRLCAAVENHVLIPSNDQQLVEDCILVCGLDLASRVAYKERPSTELIHDLAAISVAVDGAYGWIGEVASTLCHAARFGRRLAVLAPGGGVTAAVAEHLSHNFRWDLNHGLADSNLVTLGSLSLSDLTGPLNDTGSLGAALKGQTDQLGPGDVAIVLALTPEDLDVLDLDNVRARGVHVYVWTAEGRGAASAGIHHTGLASSAHAVATQIAGHLLLRVAYAFLLGQPGASSPYPPITPLRDRDTSQG
jgi:D-sedoheptulose 7-phosphate isomerase